MLLERVEALRRQHGRYVEALGWALLWLVVSPLVMTSIKTLVSSTSLSFPYPWMLIGFSNLGTWICCHALRLVPGCLKDSEDVETNVPWKQAAALGLLQGFEVGIGADIIHRISLTLRTEIHMLCPAIMFVFALAVGIEKFKPQLVLSVVVVTIGGLMSSYGTLTWEGADLVPLALLASMMSTVRWVLTQKWLAPLGEAGRPTPIVLALRMSPITSFVGFLVAAVREPAAYQGLLFLPSPEKVACLLVIISLGVCFMLVAEMRVVQLTSALLLGFLVPFHNVSVILLDVSMKGAKVSGFNWMGIVLCAAASGFYAMARKEDSKDHLAVQFRGDSLYQSTGTATQEAAGIC